MSNIIRMVFELTRYIPKSCGHTHAYPIGAIPNNPARHEQPKTFKTRRTSASMLYHMLQDRCGRTESKQPLLQTFCVKQRGAYD